VGWTYNESQDLDFTGYRVWVCDGAGCWDGGDMALAREFVLGDDDPASPTYWPFEPYEPGAVRYVTFVDSIVTVDPVGTIVIEIGTPLSVVVTAATVDGGDSFVDCVESEGQFLSRGIYTGPKIEFVEMLDKSFRIGWTMGPVLTPSDPGIPEGGGYRVLMRKAWEPAGFEIVREYMKPYSHPSQAHLNPRPGEPGYWGLGSYNTNPIRVYDSADPVYGREVHNAFPYEFAVTAFMTRGDPMHARCIARVATDTLYPTAGVQENADIVQVIPNPYRAGADWESGAERRVAFIGLPPNSTIRIYTVAADHVITLDPAHQRDDQHDWDLTNEDGEDVAPGVYLWQVEAPNAETNYGRVMIIK